MRYLLMTLGLLAMALAACTPATPAPEPTAPPPAGAEPTAGPALQPVATPVAATTAEAAYPVEIPVIAGDGAYPAPTAAVGDYPAPTANSDAAYPGPVDGGDALYLTPDMERLIAAAKADLSEETGAAADDIRLVSMELTTWSDGGLGCPEPGMMYTQALVDGYILLLQVDDTVYSYHTAGTTSFVRCESGRPTSFGSVDGS